MFYEKKSYSFCHINTFNMDLTKDFQLFIKQHPHCTIYLFYFHSPTQKDFLKP